MKPVPYVLAMVGVIKDILGDSVNARHCGGRGLRRLVRFIFGDTGVPYGWEYGDHAGKSLRCSLQRPMHVTDGWLTTGWAMSCGSPNKMNAHPLVNMNPSLPMNRKQSRAEAAARVPHCCGMSSLGTRSSCVEKGHGEPQ
jgi:hypothetical protein